MFLSGVWILSLWKYVSDLISMLASVKLKMLAVGLHAVTKRWNIGFNSMMSDRFLCLEGHTY